MLFYSSMNCSFWNTFVGGDHIGWKFHPFLFSFLWVLRKFLMQLAYLHEYLPQTTVQASIKQYIFELQEFCLFGESNSILHKQFLFHGFYPFVPASRAVALLGCRSVLPLVPSPGISWSCLTREWRVSSVLKRGQVVESHRRDSPTACS